MRLKIKFRPKLKIKRERLAKIFAVIFILVPVAEILLVVSFYLIGPQGGMTDWLQNSSYFTVTVMFGILICHLGLAQVMYVKERYTSLIILGFIVGLIAIFPLTTIYKTIYGP